MSSTTMCTYIPTLNENEMTTEVLNRLVTGYRNAICRWDEYYLFIFNGSFDFRRSVRAL